jgi:SAM-dependent methyltransferase
MHQQALAYIGATAKTFPSPALVVDLGGLNINGSPRWLFDGANYVSVDVVYGPGVDVVANATTYKPANGDLADIVICAEVLEHTPEAPEIVRNAIEILRPGGLFIMTAAGPNRAPHSAVDGGRLRMGEFYRNVTRELLAEWIASCGALVASYEVSEDEVVGDIRLKAVRA